MNSKMIPVSVANAELRHFYESQSGAVRICEDSSGCSSPAMLGSAYCLDHNGRVDPHNKVEVDLCAHVTGCTLFALPGGRFCSQHAG